MSVKRIVLISCGKRKCWHKAQAQDLYQGALFRKSLRYARTLLKPDMIYALSAKHHLVDLEKEIEPYDLTLRDMSAAERRRWAAVVLEQLDEVADLRNDHFTLLAGVRYREHLIPHISHCCIPMRGLRIGEQLHFLTEELRNG